MVRYFGGKQKNGHEIAESIYCIAQVIREDYGVEFKGYCEPFVGMAGVYQHIPDFFTDQNLQLKAGDFNPNLILMWKAFQRGWNPPLKCTETNFYKYKENNRSSAVKGFHGFTYARRGIFLTAYDQDMTTPQIKKYKKQLQESGKTLEKVNFSSGDYSRFSGLKNYIIYCDPPYTNTEQRYFDNKRNMPEFDSDGFWDWCREMSGHNLVFVSEYQAPKDAYKVWSKGKEKLYLIDPDLI